MPFHDVLSRYLFVAGAVPFLVLGAAHAFATPRTPEQSKGLSPADPAVRAEMARATLLLTRRTTLWLAWVGFNLSHSLGVILFGTVVLLIGRSEAVFAREAAVFLPLAVVVSIAYLILAVRFWFRTPIAGVAVSLVLFLGSWVLFAVER